MKPKLNEEQAKVLKAFAKRHGRQWRYKLEQMWLRGTDVLEPDGHILRQIRNGTNPQNPSD